MQREIPPSFLSKRKQLVVGGWGNEGSFREPEKGSISTDGTFTWLYRGPWLVVTSLKGERTRTGGGESFALSKASFADLLEDSSLTIQHVREFRDHLSPTDPNFNPYLLLVVLVKAGSTSASSDQSSASVICIYDARRGIILRSVDCPMQVRMVEPIIVSEEGRAPSLVACINHEMESFHGLIAIGCSGGLVSFLDLALDQEVDDGAGAIPRKLTYAARSSPTRTYDMEGKRQIALVHRQHICLPLNADCQKKHFFIYRLSSEESSAQASTLSKMQSEAHPLVDTFITCLKYIPQINALCVAFNFGGYHVYDMKSLSILFTGSIQGLCSAVVDFSFQEPQDDPKNHCYLWFARGSTVKECGEYGVASIHLNVISFKDKDWVDDFGYLYTNFIDSTCMFDYECTGFPYLADPETCSLSMIINCGTLELGSPWYYKSSDGENTNDLSLYFVSWEATNESSSDAPLTYFAIFDINQYYQAQMPKSLSPAKDSSLCPFFGIFSLTEVTNHLPNETILDFHIDPQSIRRYRSNVYNHDLHYFPSSLSFSATALTEKSALDMKFCGLQRMALNKICSSPPAVLVDPKESLKSFYFSGLLPTGHASDLDVSGQREAVLLVLLQNEQLPFLTAVIKSWSAGELDHIGCSLSFLSDWIGRQVSQIKATIDEVTAPLFPSSLSGNATIQPYDESYATKTLCACQADLKNLSFLLGKILFYGSERMSTNDIQEVQSKQKWADTLSTYLRILMWMVDTHLLPETVDSSENGESSTDLVVYPKNFLFKLYKDKRKKLKELNPALKHTQFLLIDGIVESVRDIVCPMWKKMGGSSLFPPPSIHAVLSIYLLQDVPLDRKHEITSYFMMELISSLPDSQSLVADRIKMFSTSLGLKSSLTTFVEGAWGIDAGLFSFALPLLMNPLVRKDYFTINPDEDPTTIAFKSDIHNRIITSLVFQEKQLEAQQFVTICNLYPPGSVDAKKSLSSPLDKDSLIRLKIHISTLLTNRQILEAFNIVRRHLKNQSTTIDPANEGDELFHHFLQGCEQMNVLRSVLRLSLNDTERKKLEFYLLHISSHAQAKHLLILHYLTTNRIGEAEKVLRVIQNNESSGGSGSSSQQQPLTEDLEILISKYKKALPPVVIKGSWASETDGETTTTTDEEEGNQERVSEEPMDYTSVFGSQDSECGTSGTTSQEQEETSTPKKSRGKKATDRTHGMRLRPSSTKKNIAK